MADFDDRDDFDKGADAAAHAIINAIDKPMRLMREALEAVEWDGEFGECPWCHGVDARLHEPSIYRGHRTDCLRQRALGLTAKTGD